MVYIETPFNKYVAQNVRRHLTCRISDSTVIGRNSELRENSVIEQSVIGANCIIGQNVTIRRSIIWDNTEIHDNCTIEDSLICDNVVINNNCIVDQGTRIDQNVHIKEGVILAKNTLVSCHKIVKVNQKVGTQSA